MERTTEIKELPFKSRSTLFFERYARAESENIQMRLVAGLLSVLLVIVIAGFVCISIRPRPVYYVPGAVSRGLAYPDTIPPAAVRSFAMAWLLGWMNYTPETVEGVYARSVKFMAPALLSQVHSQAAEELEKVRRDRLSSVFMLSAEPQLEEEKGLFKTVFEGKRRIYMGKEEMSSDMVRYVVALSPMPATDENPYGLSVSDIKKEEVMDAF